MHQFLEKIILAIFGVTFFLGMYRIWGYVVYEVPYGYDPGFFRHAIQGALNALPGLPGKSDPSLPYHEPLFSLMSVMLVFVGYTPDQIIGPFLAFLSVFTGFSVYLLGKQLYGRSVGLVSASIFFLSIVQYEAYWMNYWRNIVGIILLLSSLALLVRNSPLMILTLAGLFAIHRPSALYLLVILFFLLFAEMIKKKDIPYKRIFFILGGGLLALPLYIREFSMLTDMIAPLTTTIGGVTMSGTFFSSRDFFFLIFPYFLVLIPAIFQKVEKKEFDIVFIGFLIGLSWSVLRLFFYNRMFVFFDIFAILLAGYSIVYIVSNYAKNIGMSIILIFFALQGYLYAHYVHDASEKTKISREEFDIVKNLDILLPPDVTILSTHRIYTPWLLGYSKTRTLAPGLLAHQIWNEEKWNFFYFTADDSLQCQMIQEYKSIAPKLYVFVGDYQPPLDLPRACFKPILSNTTHPIVYEVLYQ